jgi:hypothetical protein
MNVTEVNKVSKYKDKVVITSRTGLTVLRRDGQAGWAQTVLRVFPVDNKTNIALTLKDSLLVNSTLFMIIENFGMVTFDMEAMKFNSKYFAHPRLVKLDSIPFRNLFYIGVLVDNLPPAIPEFFIEFAFNYTDPSSPMINKIFVTERDVNVKDVASDDQLGLTYVMEPETNSLYVLTRGIANNIGTYNFVVDFKGYYSFNSTQKLELMLISENDAYFPALVINSGTDYVVFSRFSYPKNTLECQMSQNGNYEYAFKSFLDCSATKNGIFNYNTCWNNATITIKADSSIKNTESTSDNEHGEEGGDIPDEGDNTGLWIILGVVVVAVVVIVVVVVCCRNVCRKNAKARAGMEYMKHNQKEGEEVEVQVMNNKL